MAIRTGKLGIVRMTGPDLTKLRDDCFSRDKGQCVECSMPLRPKAPSNWIDSYHMAHIVPRSRGGPDTLENVRALCRDCHLIGDHNPKPVPAKERV